MTKQTVTAFVRALENIRENPEQGCPGMPEITRELCEWALEWADEAPTGRALLEWSLESIDCSGAHSPGGLVYNGDIADKLMRYWDEIDAALEHYEDATGSRWSSADTHPRSAQTVLSYVWFAYEYAAHCIASLVQFNAERFEEA